ncbi:hypothetical protein BLOT_014101 [Blomia tropicalis]|nr:hypothetical protein BLOT_014101 [Blomia tropicalis]
MMYFKALFALLALLVAVVNADFEYDKRTYVDDMGNVHDNPYYHKNRVNKVDVYAQPAVPVRVPVYYG